MTRQLKQFFDGFALGKLTVTIKRHPQTEFLLNVKAPARIIARRKTIAVDEKVEMNQILDTVEPVIPIRAARVITRRNTTIMDHPDLEPFPFFNEVLPRQNTTAVNTVFLAPNLELNELLARGTQVVDTSEQPLDLTMKTGHASTQSDRIDKQVLLLETPINTSQQRCMPRNLFGRKSSNEASAKEYVSASQDVEAIEHNNVPDEQVLQANQMPKKVIPDLLPINLEGVSENVPSLNLAKSPLQYAEYWKRRIGSNGPFSDSTNLQKK